MRSDINLEPVNCPALTAIIVGGGFGGVGMAIQLRQAGIEDFVILEKAGDVGGVWRDNTYPGAACDVPAHLYSFSFEPKPDWSRVFAPQPEIHEYLRHCAQKHDLYHHILFGAEVAEARFDEARSLWRVSLNDGRAFEARVLVSATGLLGRPSFPRIPGRDDFVGPSFHSGAWDPGCSLGGKRVAVIGTGASAIQLVPAIAPAVAKLTLFQRTPAYVLPKADRAYRGWEKRLFACVPLAMRAYRAAIYLAYEARAIAFTRLTGLLAAAGVSFRKALAARVVQPELREKLTPAYTPGCKRILLSNDYYPALARSNVELVTEGIRRFTTTGVETDDGSHREVDAIIYATGFAATEFLAPMRIVGRGGVAIEEVWESRAAGFLGLSVPGFPNFFMLYGPNTNLGHNSIVYMLESQIAHVVECVRALRRRHAAEIEIEADRFAEFNSWVQRRLARTVWAGCASWYVDRHGHNSVNWPSFTFIYRRMTKRRSLSAYRFTTPLVSADGTVEATAFAASDAPLERIVAAGIRAFLRSTFRPLMGPPFGVSFQRCVMTCLTALTPGERGVRRKPQTWGGVRGEMVTLRKIQASGVVLYLHGGAFCLGSPRSHRAITTRLALASSLSIWAPKYRLAPEHPYSAALEDALACYKALSAQGYRIALAGDSAGGRLALELAMRLRDVDAVPPMGIGLISPVADAGALDRKDDEQTDPMLRVAWLGQALRWYGGAKLAEASRPLQDSLRNLPPLLIQVGREEILLRDSVRLAAGAAAAGTTCHLELYEGRWHVFHLQAAVLDSASRAIERMGAFFRSHFDAAAASDGDPMPSVDAGDADSRKRAALAETK
jgi:cation diffusion facilitator CzcD-associated flavoprotein CzcO/acetyl esterase/lipase